jgi:CubicO group peptidase (beta-lactamase class C family)
MRLAIRKIALPVLCTILCTTSCLAQKTLQARIDAFVNSEMKWQQIPGMAVAVVRNGKIEVLRTYGFSNLEHRIPVKPETIFQSGSIGKQFTAAAVMILAAEGKLSLEDTLSKFFADAPASWSQITVRQLLTHTAGMGDYPAEFDLRRDHTEAELLAMIKATPLAYAPGTNWDYSNLGYVTLGILIHQVSGKFHSDFVTERIFKPLGMETARLISEADIIPNRAAGYRLVDGKLQNQEWVSPSTNTTADGCYYFSILDLAKWDAALYTDTPLAQSRLAEMWTPVKLDGGRSKAYGFGWNTNVLHGHRILFHGGAWQGFKSFIVRFPDDKITIILFANSWDARDFRLARGLVATVFPEFALPSAAPITDKEPNVTALTRRMLLQISEGKASADAFTPTARTSFFPDQAKEVAVRLNSLSLPIALIFTNELIERREENGLRVYRYALTDISSSLFCTVRLASNDKIAGVKCEQN